MFLVELVMQGVRGFRELARLRLLNGFNLITADNEAGKTTAVDTIQRLLFPNNQAGFMDTLISKQTPDASRGALVMFSDDGGYYRIIQDFSKQAVNLSKYDTDTKDFTLLYKDWDSAVTFMTRLNAGLSEGDFEKIFVFRRDHYASSPNAFIPTPSTPKAVPSIQPVTSAVISKNNTAGDQKKLAELREVLKKAEEAADAEYRAQSAQIALDEIRKKLTTLEESERKKSEIDAKLKELKGCDSLPENLTDLIDACERQQAQKAAEAEELINHLTGLKIQLEAIPVVSLFADKFFVAGLALVAVSIIAGLFILTGEYANFFLIGVLLALGLMMVAWYSGSRKNTQRNAILKEIKGLEKERGELEKRSEPESQTIKAFMKSTATATPRELKEHAENYRYFLSLRDDIEEQRQRLESDTTPEMMQKEYNKRQQEALELDKAAKAVAQYNIDTYAIRQGIERIESASSPGSTIAWDVGADVQVLPPVVSILAASSRQVAFHADLSIASRIGGIEMETLIPAVEAAAQRNLVAITNGKYVRVDVGHDGEPPAVRTRDDQIVRYEDQSHGTRDLIYFCLRSGLVEALVGKLRMPIILDDILAGFDAARQKAACQILRTLGAKTQVILFSSNVSLKAEGDGVVEFK